VQLLVRRMDRARNEQTGPRRRYPDRGRHSDRGQGRSPGDAHDVVRVVPEDRHGCDHDTGPLARPAHDPERAEGSVTFGYGTLGAVTDVDPSLPGPTGATTPAAAPA